MEPYTPRPSSCQGPLHHFANLLFFGKCACWDEGRNRSRYWGWKEA